MPVFGVAGWYAFPGEDVNARRPRKGRRAGVASPEDMTVPFGDDDRRFSS